MRSQRVFHCSHVFAQQDRASRALKARSLSSLSHLDIPRFRVLTGLRRLHMKAKETIIEVPRRV